VNSGTWVIHGWSHLREAALLQVYGPESSGKTTLALHAIAEVQRQGGTAALIDAEHAFDPEYSRVPPAGRVPGEPSALWLAFCRSVRHPAIMCALHGCDGQDGVRAWPTG